jgi:hypothetical protein
MEEKNKTFMAGLLCYWAGVLLALGLNFRGNSTHQGIIIVGGLVLPAVVTYLSGKR